MPHLSPMNWLIALLSFWLILFTLSSMQWWNQNTVFPKKSISMKKSINLWKWL